MEKNLRRAARIALQLPVRVTGHEEPTGKWQEIGETLDVSRTGVSLKLARRVTRGQVLYLSLPLPWRLRLHGHAEASYQVYAVVQRVRPGAKPGERCVGLEFVGEHPPRGYLDKPWTLYKPAEWRGESRRRHPREYRAEVACVTYLDEHGGIIRQEIGRTVDVSRKGARICVQQPPAEFDIVRVMAPESGFEGDALVVAQTRRQEGFYHLSLCFLGCEWPLGGK